MKNVAYLIALCWLVSGCSTMAQSSQPYRAKGADSVSMITGNMSYNPVGESSLQLSIGSDVVASGILAASGNGIVSGNWRGQPVNADCSRVFSWGGRHNVRCMVMVSGEHASTLNFSPYD